MRRSKRVTLVTLVILIILVPLSLRTLGQAAPCQALSYFIAYDTSEADIDAPDVLHVSLDKAHFTVSALKCLSQVLEQKRRDRRFTIFFFDERYAADEFVLSEMELTREIKDSHRRLRAFYEIGPSQRRGVLTLTPLGYGSSTEFNTTIDFATEKAASCRFSFGGRCLLSLELDPLSAVESEGDERAVTLRATISSNGHVNNIRAVAPPGGASAKTNHLLNASMLTLKHWWFEPSSNTTPIYVNVLLNDRKVLSPRSGLAVDLTASVSVRLSEKQP